MLTDTGAMLLDVRQLGISLLDGSCTNFMIPWFALFISGRRGWERSGSGGQK